MLTFREALSNFLTPSKNSFGICKNYLNIKSIRRRQGLKRGFGKMTSHVHTSNRKTSSCQSGSPVSSLLFPFIPRFLKPVSDFDEILCYPF
jgi:hypothetical protein